MLFENKITLTKTSLAIVHKHEYYRDGLNPTLIYKARIIRHVTVRMVIRIALFIAMHLLQ